MYVVLTADASIDESLRLVCSPAPFKCLCDLLESNSHHSFVFNIHLYVPDSVLGTGDAAVSKGQKALPS